jgi:hypothetical protein
MKMKFQSMGGLTIKDGRLINDKPDGMSGIAQAAMIRKEVKRERKVSMIADGIMRAELREQMFGKQFVKNVKGV